eukprot:c4221_g1_i1.p1 GENE.c4221_g1_i1~~c4221_g1_i1.p1  ORF type:complete len:101 (-),score=19.70 c4221_g1_i1:199-501(-)
MSHTILLLQPTQQQTSRTYQDFENVQAAMEAVCGMYEKKLKKNNPAAQNITYDISDLFAWVDSQFDMACLVFEPSTQSYLPHPKDWIKTKIYQNLQRQIR